MTLQKPPFSLHTRHTLVCLLMLATPLAVAETVNPSTANKTVSTKKTVPAKKVSTTKDEKLLTLDTMEVTSTSVGRGSKVEVMDISTTVVTREQIRSAPELTLDQILNQQMGIIISNVPQNQVDPTASVVQMRGMAGGEKVLLMVDGVPYNDGYFRTIDWSQIPKDTIEKVEIIRGGGGAAMWGNLAMGGVINVITRAPEKGEKRVGFAYGNYNTMVGDAAFTAISNDKIRSGFNFNTIDSDGYNTAPKFDQTTPNLVASGTRVRNGLWSTYFTPNVDSKYFIKIAGSELLQDKILYQTANNQWYKLDLRIGGKNKYSETGSFNFSGFFDYSQMHKSNGALTNDTPGYTGLGTIRNPYKQNGVTPNLLTGAGVAASGVVAGQDEDMHYESYGTSAYIEDAISLNNWGTVDDIKFGLDVRGVTTSDSNNLYAQNGTSSSNAAGKPSTSAAVLATTSQFATYDMAGQNVFEGIFAQGTYKPKGIPMQATLGIRQDFWQAILAEQSQTYFQNAALYKVTPASNATQKPGDTFFNQINPRLGLKYNFDSGIDIRGAAYRNFAAPGMNQLYRTFASASTVSGSNAELIPETSFGQEIGIDFTGRNVRTTFTAYHNEIDNYINSTNMCGTGSAPQSCSPAVLASLGYAGTSYTGVNKNLNIGTVTTAGAELFGEWKASDVLKLTASGIYTHAVLDSFNSASQTLNSQTLAAKAGNAPLFYTGRQLPNVPIAMFTQGGSLNILPNLTYGWAIRTWPTFPSTTQNGVNVNGTGRNNSAATTADMHLSYKPTKMLELYMNVQNIADAYYNSTTSTATTAPSTIGTPRMYLGGFKLNF